MRAPALPTCLVLLASAALSGHTAVRTGPTGHYEYRDAEMAGSVDLRENGSFTYRIDYIGPPVEGEAPMHERIEGVWRAGPAGQIALTNQPTAPPRFEQIGARRDPKVLAAITVVRPDGRPASGLAINAGDGYANVVTDSVWSLPLQAAQPSLDPITGKRTPAPVLSSIAVLREGDDRLLATIPVTPGGPNRFVFRYQPSPVEPFTLGAAIDLKTGLLHVELGQAELSMRRVGPAR